MILIGTKYKILLQMLLLSLTVCFEEAQPTPSDYDYSGDEGIAAFCGYNRSLSNSSAIMITSPGWPNAYTHNEICEWTISTSSGYRLEITFNSFSTEESYDTFSGYENGIRVFIHSGQNIPSRWTSSGNIIVLRFISDGSLALNGFQILIRRVPMINPTTQPPSTSTDKCSSLTSYLPVTTAIGILQSPNFPSFYPENSNCIWNLTAPVGMAILLNFSIFQTEFCCDTLEVFENGSMQLRLSGTRNREQYISSSNSVELVFISDDSISELGFYIYYVIANEGTTISTITPTTTTQHTTTVATSASTRATQPTTTMSTTVRTTTKTTTATTTLLPTTTTILSTALPTTTTTITATTTLLPTTTTILSTALPTTTTTVLLPTTTTMLSTALPTTATKVTTQRTQTTRTNTAAKTTPETTQTLSLLATATKHSTNGKTSFSSLKATTTTITRKPTSEPLTTSTPTNITSMAMRTESERRTFHNTVGHGPDSPTTPSSAVTWLSRSLVCALLLFVSFFCKEF